MMKLLSTLVLAFAVLTLGLSARLLAHEGHEHKVMGTVTMAAADHVMLKDKDGKDVMVKVTSDTKVKAKSGLKVQEIKPGTRVVVSAVEEKDKSMTAKTIEVGAAPAAAK
jgi:phosphopantetheine adenylyltransferase